MRSPDWFARVFGFLQRLIGAIHVLGAVAIGFATHWYGSVGCGSAPTAWQQFGFNLFLPAISIVRHIPWQWFVFRPRVETWLYDVSPILGAWANLANGLWVDYQLSLFGLAVIAGIFRRVLTDAGRHRDLLPNDRCS